MVDDPPFAAFLDALLAALEAVGAIVAGSQTSFDDMVGAWAGAAPPAWPAFCFLVLYFTSFFIIKIR